MVPVTGFLRHNAVAFVALFVALGGAGYAAVKINGSDIKNATISGKKLKKHTLTGKQINVSQLGTVPSAQSAASATTATTASTAINSNSLGGVPAASYLTSGCGPGKVNGYAVIDGQAPSFPATYTSAAPFISNTFNCSGQPVQVLRHSAGVYILDLPGNPGTIGFGSGEECVVVAGPLCVAANPHTVSVTFIRSGPYTGAFQVAVRDSTSGTATDGAVNVLIP